MSGTRPALPEPVWSRPKKGTGGVKGAEMEAKLFGYLAKRLGGDWSAYLG